MTPDEHKWLSDSATVWIEGSLDAERNCGSVLRSWLAEHPPVPSVPVAELSPIRDSMREYRIEEPLDALIAKYTPMPVLPPNTEKPGTYLWAYEEHRRGRTVRLLSTNDFPIRPSSVWAERDWWHAHFVATDWEVVP